MILIDHVAKRFKANPTGGSLRAWRAAPTWVAAVHDISLHAHDGCITGLLGPNGAGKTTTLRMLGGLIVPDQGRIAVDGIAVADQPRAALARMGLLGDSHGLYPRLTARENIVYFGQLHGLSRAAAQTRAEQLCDLLDLHSVFDRRADGFSQGERMKTALARALVHDPPNIVLDEPTNGLDVLATRALRQALRTLAHTQGKCVVFSSHVMQEVEYLCDAVVVVSQGRSVATGSVDALKQRTGQTRFEDAFVALAFADTPLAPAPTEAQQP